MCLTRFPSSARNYAATRIAGPYSLFASPVIVGSATAVTNAVRRSGVSSGRKLIAVTSKAKQVEKLTVAASNAIGAGPQKPR